MTTINEFTTGMLYAFDTQQYIFASILATGSLIAFLGQTIVIISTLYQGDFTVANKMVLSLCISEWILAGNVSYHGTSLFRHLTLLLIAIMQLVHGGWATGPIDCIAHAIITLSCEGISLYSVLGITIDRFDNHHII